MGIRERTGQKGLGRRFFSVILGSSLETTAMKSDNTGFLIPLSLISPAYLSSGLLFPHPHKGCREDSKTE
jgi:hypothetical protein